MTRAGQKASKSLDLLGLAVVPLARRFVGGKGHRHGQINPGAALPHDHEHSRTPLAAARLGGRPAR